MAKYDKWLEEDNLILIQAWARDGLSEKQIAYNMGISYSTFREWKKKYSALSAVLTRTREITDYIVENSLYKNANGHIVILKKPMKLRTEKGVGKDKIIEERVEYVDEEIYVPPNEKAEEFWLKNRKPETWKDKTEPRTELDKTLDKAREILGGVTSVIN